MSVDLPPLMAIDHLPDALLLDIIELDHGEDMFPPPTYWRPDHEKSTVRSISKVCKRWNAVSSPLLYRRISVEQFGEEGIETTRKRLSSNL